MSIRKKKDLAMPVSWRNLKPSSARKSSSRIVARKRFVTFARVFVYLIIASGIAGSVVYQQLRQPNSNVVGQSDYTGPSIPIQRIDFRSDGVLNDKWFLNWMGPIRGLSLAQVNLVKLQHNLLQEDQIIEVKVKRNFPSTLQVFVKERVPLLVLRLRDNQLEFRDWLVSSDGLLYEGSGYSTAMMNLLPSLKIPGALIQKKDNNRGYKKLEGIPVIAPLLELARSEYPEIFRDWTVVSYNRPSDKDPGANVTVKSRRIGTIRFNPSDYSSQLKRLRYLLDEPKFLQASFIRSIDLSHGRSVFAKI
jgi:hypothetical protein